MRGTLRLRGVKFEAYSGDHEPMHVHATYGEVEVLVEFDEDSVWIARRHDAIRPRSGKRSHVRHILDVAADAVETFVLLWKEAHAQK